MQQQSHDHPAWRNHAAQNFDVILEGGSMRGLFTAGVCDFFMERGLFPRYVIGTSAGALNGYNYVAGAIGRTAYLNIKYCDDPRYLSLASYVRTGNVLGYEFMFDEIPNKLDPFDPAWFEGSPTRLISVASDLVRGDADYHEHTPGDDSQRLRNTRYLDASASMPLVSTICEIDGKHLLDGGVCDSVPYLHSRLTGMKKQIVVLTQDATYVKHPNKLMALANVRYNTYPLFLERMAGRHYEYNLTYRRLARLHEQGDIFIIRPASPVTVKALENDRSKLFDLYQQGYYQAATNWNAVQRYLEL